MDNKAASGLTVHRFAPIRIVDIGHSLRLKNSANRNSRYPERFEIVDPLLHKSSNAGPGRLKVVDAPLYNISKSDPV